VRSVLHRHAIADEDFAPTVALALEASPEAIGSPRLV
jgi:hypothetical protein